MPSRSIIIGALCLLFVGILAFFGAISPAQANSSLTVTTTTDVTDPTDGLCSLREATAAVASGTGSGSTAGECPAGSPGDTILVPAGTYTLTQGQIVITASLIISGSGQVDTIIDGNNQDRIFEITGTTTAVNLDGLTLQNGQAYVTSTMDANGGAIFAAGPITVTNSTLVSNTAASFGGGIYVYTGTQALVEDSDLSGNQSEFGAAVFNAGELVLSHTSVLSNTAADMGVIQNGAAGSPATAFVQNSLFSGNSAGEATGILNWVSSRLTITNTNFIGNGLTPPLPGASVLENGGLASISGSTFEGNQSDTGPAIYNDVGELSVQNSTFTHNTATNSGGAVATLGGHMTIADSTFDGNSASLEGGAIYGADPFTLTHTSLTDNTAGLHGGAVAQVNSAPLFADAITVTNNSAQVGGGLFVLGPLQLISSQVVGNSASQEGGGVYLNLDATISQTQIFSNTANQGGGVSAGQHITLTHSALIGNSAANLGGGLYVVTGTQALVTDSQLLGNASTTAHDAGGIYSAGALTVTNSTIADSLGQGVHNDHGQALIDSTTISNSSDFGLLNDTGSMVITGSTLMRNAGAARNNLSGGANGMTVVNSLFSQNTDNPAADNGAGGGAIANYGSQLTITSSSFISNSATSLPDAQGGAIWSFLGLGMTISHSTFAGNTQGAIFNEGGGSPTATVSIADSLFSNNQGSAIDNTADSLSIRASTFFSNSAPGGGGAVNDNSQGLTISGSAFFSNTAGADAGAVKTLLSPVNITNSTFSGNQAGRNAGALEFVDGTARLNNVTIAGNSAAHGLPGLGGGGLVVSDTAVVTATNTLIAGNTDSAGQALDCAGTLVTGGHNLIQSTAGCTLSGTAPGDITGTAALLAPLQDNGGPTWTQALLAGSPAIDAGSPAAPGGGGAACEATDQRGVVRPQGPACDIGAFEAVGLSATATVQFAGSAFTTTQSAGTVPITVTLSRGMPVTVTIQYSTSDGTALAGADYAAASGMLTFTPGVTENAFTISIAPGSLHNVDKSLGVTLSNPASSILGVPYSAVVIILNSHPAPGVSFSSSHYVVAEGGGATVITATLSAASDLTATVNYSTSNGTALAGSDYTAPSGTLTFTPGLTQTAFTVPIVNDFLHEPDETFQVALSNPAGASLDSPETATVTIHDDDPVPGVAFSSATYSQTESSGAAAITVTLSAASGVTTTVHFATSNGTATAGSDYTPVSGTLTFAPGQTQQTFMVPVTDDMLLEGPETVLLTLSDPTGAVLGISNTAMLVIQDNDVEHRLYLPLVVGP